MTREEADIVKDLVVFLRAQGVRHFQRGDLTITLSPQAPRQPPAQDEPAVSEDMLFAHEGRGVDP